MQDLDLVLQERAKYKRGAVRVKLGKFRLYYADDCHEIDMSQPFELVFKSRRRFVTTAYFEWFEVNYYDCPNCGSELSVETRGIYIWCVGYLFSS